jgi:hypothetical protein
MGVWWFRWHYGLLLIAVLFTLVAAGLIMNAKGWILFENIHTTIGTVMVIAAVTQVVLGIFIDRMFRPSRRSTPLRDKLHWWLGRLLTLAAVVNIFLGIEVAELGVIYWYFAYAGLLVLTAALFWVGQQQSGGQQHHEHLSDEHIAMAKNKHSSEESFI